MPSSDGYLATAWQAAPSFGLAPTEIRLLSHSENVVCAATMADGTRVAIRIHRPGYNSMAELRSEVQWVRSLGAFGVPVCAADFSAGVAAYKRSDFAAAIEQFTALAGTGDARAQFALGLMYDNGEGVTADRAEAVAWYTRSAEQGYGKAQYNLALLLAAGNATAPGDSGACT